jgi:Mg-chelatase subunit ChlD
LDGEKKLEESISRRQGRVEIALPQGERGEALEKQRVAVGPIVISEVMANSPSADNKPADEFVALATNAAILHAADGFVTYSLVNGQQSDDQSALADAAMRTAGLEGLNRQLETSLAVRERLQSRVWQEKVDAAMPKNAVVEQRSSSKARLFSKLDTIRVDNLRYDAQPLNQVIDDLAKKARALDPAKQGINLVVSGQADPQATSAASIDPSTGLPVGGDQSGLSDLGAATVTINQPLHNVTLRQALEIVSKAADRPINLSVEDWGVLLTAGTNKLESKIAQNEAPVRKPSPTAPIPQPEVATAENAFSTFSLNVSDVSFKLAAASLEKGQMPDPATVRSEEFINAFDYRDPEPKGSAPIAFAWERARYPFAHDRDLVRFSVKTAASGRQPGRPLNLVLLLDNSGSMERADRVRIRQECLRVLASQLRPEDRVSVIAFARTARLVVDGFSGKDAGNLPQVVGQLAPDGGTNLEEAMNLAYQTALKHFLANGVNRVVLLTDGAANLGDVQPESLKKKVEAHRKQGVALDCFGIGWDGLDDELLEALSRNGDGRYGFVNTPEAATTEFATQLAGALKVAASDVKVQVEWNPRRVTAYRQIGYAKHQLKKEQFRDNTVDAAEIGAAEAGNALYTVQVNPRGEGPLGTVRVRFKVPATSDYREHEWPLAYDGSAKPLDQSSPALRLAASASAFSEWLVSSPFAAEVTPDKLLGYLGGVPETWPADPRPKKLEWMIRQAKSVAGK